jgi:hypothetical protein
MVEKIYWQEPDETSVTTVEISRATDKHGTYSVIANIDATSDGEAKSASNTWVVTYTDTGGSKNHWYKVRFYDGSFYSDYSDPITANKEIKLCTIEDVKKNIKTTGRFTDDEIFDAIDDIEEEIYDEMGTPIKNILTLSVKLNDVLQDTYYLGEQNLYRVDRFFYGTSTKVEYFLDDGYKVNLKYGMLKILPVASGGPTLHQDSDLEVSFVSKIYNKYATYKTCEYLLEQVDYVNRGSVSKELATIRLKLGRVEKRLMYQNGFGMSSQFEGYSKTYPNQTRIKQNADKNKYLGSYGW